MYQSVIYEDYEKNCEVDRANVLKDPLPLNIVNFLYAR